MTQPTWLRAELRLAGGGTSAAVRLS